MSVNQFDRYLEEHVTILTEGERIEGSVFFGAGARLSDFLNAPMQQDCQFVKVKDATVQLRQTGEQLGQVPFLMVDRNRIVLVMTHEPVDDVSPASITPTARLLRAEPAARRNP